MKCWPHGARLIGSSFGVLQLKSWSFLLRRMMSCDFCVRNRVLSWLSPGALPTGIPRGYFHSMMHHAIIKRSVNLLPTPFLQPNLLFSSSLFIVLHWMKVKITDLNSQREKPERKSSLPRGWSAWRSIKFCTSSTWTRKQTANGSQDTRWAMENFRNKQFISQTSLVTIVTKWATHPPRGRCVLLFYINICLEWVFWINIEIKFSPVHVVKVYVLCGQTGIT